MYKLLNKNKYNEFLSTMQNFIKRKQDITDMFNAIVTHINIK